jgi:hypothetical protein
MSANLPGFDIPVVIGPNGATPQTPQALQTQLMNNALALSPGITQDLPLSLIEDINATQVSGLSILDQARVASVNNVSPNSVNAFILLQLSRALGLQLGSPTNTSVLVVFTGTPGYVIPAGFRISDGTNVYSILTGGVIGAGGLSLNLTAVCVAAGPFAVPPNTVTQLKTSVPNTIALSVNNPQAGIPALSSESWSSFRSRVQQAMLAACTSGPRLIKTLVGNVPGVPSNLIATQAANGGIRVIVGGGGDVFQVAYAIYSAVDNPAILQGSAVNNNRNVAVTLFDPPDTFNIVYVNSPAQALTGQVIWNTSLANFTGGGAFASLTQVDLAAYINSLMPGQAINVLELNELFAGDVAPVLPPALLNRLIFELSINGVLTPEGAGTYSVAGDIESYFQTPADGSGFSITQG